MKLVYCLAAFLSSIALCCAQTSIHPKEALSSYERYLKSIDSISFSSRFVDRIDEESEVFTNGLLQTWKINFGKRALWRTTRKIDPASKENLPEKSAPTFSEALVMDDAVYEIAVNSKAAVAERFSAYLTVPEDYWEKYNGLGYLSCPFGYIKDGREYRYIPGMTRGKLSLEDHGESLTVICEAEGYECRIQLSPIKGWMAERIEYKQVGDQGDPSRPKYFLYEVDSSGSYDGIWLPEAYFCKIVLPSGQKTLSQNLRMIDGKVVIVPEGNDVGARLVDKPQRTLFAEVTLFNFNLDSLSDSDFQVQATVSDGMEVSMQDALHLEHVWLEGEIVPRTEAMLIAKNDAEFVGGRGFSRFWLYLLNGFLLVVCLCIGFRQWFLSSRQ